MNKKLWLFVLFFVLLASCASKKRINTEKEEENEYLLDIYLVAYEEKEVDLPIEMPRSVVRYNPKYIGRITINKKYVLTCNIIDENAKNRIVERYQDGVKNGLLSNFLYKNEPDPTEYPANGELHYIKGWDFWSWHGIVKKGDSFFIKAFLDRLYKASYLELEYQVGEKYINFSDYNKISEKELIKGTILKRGDAIYEYNKEKNEYKIIKEEPYLKDDPIPVYK